MSGRTPRILVVDDEEMIRESLQMYLESQGWDVVAAASAEEAMVATKLMVLPQTRRGTDSRPCQIP